MEERKTLFDYIAEVLIIFGVVIIILNLLCVIYGEDAREYSSMFALGKEGVSVKTAMQFLAVSVLTVLLKFLFFTDTFIKKMSVVLRTVGMLISLLFFFGIFIIKFQWFPADLWEAWVHFFICFFLCFVVSTVVTMWKERIENRRMQEALLNLKNREESENAKRK